MDTETPEGDCIGNTLFEGNFGYNKYEIIGLLEIGETPDNINLTKILLQ